MSVIKINEYKSRETAQALQCLADMAKRGEVIGVALCYLTSDHQDNCAFTGAYKNQPAMAVNAAMRLSWRLTQIQDEACEA